MLRAVAIMLVDPNGEYGWVAGLIGGAAIGGPIGFVGGGLSGGDGWNWGRAWAGFGIGTAVGAAIGFGTSEQFLNYVGGKGFLSNSDAQRVAYINNVKANAVAPDYISQMEGYNAGLGVREAGMSQINSFGANRSYYGNLPITPNYTATATYLMSALNIDGIGGYNIDNAVNYLNVNAQPKAMGVCARMVRLAINAGGITINWPRPVSAKDYGPTLIEYGFTETENTVNSVHQKGDIVVIQSINGHPHGHIAMYNGEQWVSDFRQRDMWCGPAYRKVQPAYKIFRWGN